MTALKNIEVRAGFKCSPPPDDARFTDVERAELDRQFQVHREYGRHVRDQLMADVLAAASAGNDCRTQLHAAEDAFERAIGSIDSNSSNALLELWCEIEGTVDGRYTIRGYVRQL